MVTQISQEDWPTEEEIPTSDQERQQVASRSNQDGNDTIPASVEGTPVGSGKKRRRRKKQSLETKKRQSNLEENPQEKVVKNLYMEKMIWRLLRKSTVIHLLPKKQEKTHPTKIMMTLEVMGVQSHATIFLVTSTVPRILALKIFRKIYLTALKIWGWSQGVLPRPTIILVI